MTATGKPEWEKRGEIRGKSSEARDRDRDGWREHGARQEYDRLGPRPEPKAALRSWRAPPDDRRLSYLDATGLDGPLDRLLARHPPGDGLQHPRPRPAADRDGLGHQHPPLEIRVSLEYRRTGREEANPGQVGDGV